MKRFLICAFAFPMMLFSVESVRAETVSGFTGNINGALGMKFLKGSDWDPNDDQILYGFQDDFRRTHWPVSIAIDVLASSRSKKRNGVRLTGQTQEFGFGVRKVWENLGTVQPFLGAGPVIVRAHSEASVSSNGGQVVTEDSGVDLGIWMGGGVLFRVTPTFNLGAGIRYSNASVELFNSDVEAGGMSYMMLAGVHF